MGDGGPASGDRNPSPRGSQPLREGIATPPRGSPHQHQHAVVNSRVRAILSHWVTLPVPKGLPSPLTRCATPIRRMCEARSEGQRSTRSYWHTPRSQIPPSQRWPQRPQCLGCVATETGMTPTHPNARSSSALSGHAVVPGGPSAAQRPMMQNPPQHRRPHAPQWPGSLLRFTSTVLPSPVPQTPCPDVSL
jgi:hypothetical protein